MFSTRLFGSYSHAAIHLRHALAGRQPCLRLSSGAGNISESDLQCMAEEQLRDSEASMPEIERYSRLKIHRLDIESAAARRRAFSVVCHGRAMAHTSVAVVGLRT
jgi:hypothetical protein